MTSNRQREEMQKHVFQIQEKVRKYAKRFSRGHWAFLGCTPEGKWDSIAAQMVERFKETGHPVFLESWNSEKQE